MITIPRHSLKAGELQLTAMIDVVFILMFFFMLTTSFMRIESLEVQLPTGKGSASKLDNITRIVLYDDHSITLNEKTVQENELQPALKNLLSHDAKAQVVVYTDETVSLQTMVGMLDNLAKLGAKSVYVRPLPHSVTPKVEAQ